MDSEDLKIKAIDMRKKGLSILEISKIIGKSKSTISTWTRGVTLTPEQKSLLLKRDNSERAFAISNNCKLRREKYQNIGKEKIKQNEPLYIAGCMLYWGEGAKSINICNLTNCELPMLILFKKFLKTYFDIPDSLLTIRINAYTDLHSQEEIENYWLNGLNLPKSCLRKTIINNLPKSSKNTARKLEYGTCRLLVTRTEVVQEILGAIQEFGSFTNENWLIKRKK